MVHPPSMEIEGSIAPLAFPCQWTPLVVDCDITLRKPLLFFIPSAILKKLDRAIT